MSTPLTSNLFLSRYQEIEGKCQFYFFNEDLNSTDSKTQSVSGYILQENGENSSHSVGRYLDLFVKAFRQFLGLDIELQVKNAADSDKTMTIIASVYDLKRYIPNFQKDQPLQEQLSTIQKSLSPKEIEMQTIQETSSPKENKERTFQEMRIRTLEGSPKDRGFDYDEEVNFDEEVDFDEEVPIDTNTEKQIQGSFGPGEQKDPILEEEEIFQATNVTPEEPPQNFVAEVPENDEEEFDHEKYEETMEPIRQMMLLTLFYQMHAQKGQGRRNPQKKKVTAAPPSGKSSASLSKREMNRLRKEGNKARYQEQKKSKRKMPF